MIETQPKYVKSLEIRVLVLIFVTQNLKNIILLAGRLHDSNLHSIAMVSFTSKAKNVCLHK